MRAMFIINPTSGMQNVQRVAHQLEQKLLLENLVSSVTVTYTTGKNDAAQKCAALRPGEFDFLVAVGGDGTVNEVVNGIIAGQCNIPLVIIPAGTCNDFATSAGLPKTADGLLEMIRNFHVIPVDVGKINDNYFLNVAAGGLLSEIAHRVSIDSKTALGRLAYLLEGAKEITNLRLDTVPLKIEYDGNEMILDVFLFVIANSKSVGGFRNIAVNATINDGLLDLCILKKIDPLDVIPVAAQIQRGNHINNKKSVCYLQAKKFVISCLHPDARFPLDFDGEKGGEFPIVVEAVPQALQLVIPHQTKKLQALIKS